MPSSTPRAGSPSTSRSSTTRGSRRRPSWSAFGITSRCGTAGAGPTRRRASSARSSGSPRALAILLDMTRTHVPVLAGELIELLDPHPGETAVDCTFGDGGHARLVAGRIGASGTLICVDRDPAAEERFESFAREVECETRFLRMDYGEALELLIEEGIAGDMAYLDLGVSSMQIDTWERGFSYSYDAPLDMRMDPGQELDARAIVNEWDERQLAQLFRSYGEERFARQIARAIGRRRERSAIETTNELVETIKSAIPAPARFGGGPPSRGAQARGWGRLMARSAAARASAAAPAHVPPRRSGATQTRRRSGRVVEPARRAPSPAVARPRGRVAPTVARFVEARTSGLLDQLLRGRLWVGFIGALLAGIVFLNVSLLQLNQDIARTTVRATALDRQNSALRTRLAVLDSAARIQRLAE